MRAGLSTTREYIATWFEPQPAASPFAGVGPADIHNRDPRDLPLVTDGADALGEGVLARSKDGGVVFFQLVPWRFDPAQQNQKRVFRRTSYALSRVLAGLGVAGRTPLLERFRDPLEPERNAPALARRPLPRRAGGVGRSLPVLSLVGRARAAIPPAALTVPRRSRAARRRPGRRLPPGRAQGATGRAGRAG